MSGRLATEIIKLYSLQELVTQLDNEISISQSLKNKYSERLGGLLRDVEEKHRDEEWFKRLSLGEKLPKGKAKPTKKGEKGGKKKKKGKKGKAETQECWIQYEDLQLSSTIQGEAELMFEAIEHISSKIEELEASKKLIEELRNLGLGEDVEYMTLIKDGAPKMIVLKPSDSAAMAKFVFARAFSSSVPNPQIKAQT